MRQRSAELGATGLLLFGAGGHARVVADAVERSGRHVIAGIIDAETPPGTLKYGYPVLANQHDCAPAVHAIGRGIIAIGDNWVRSRVAALIARIMPGFQFVTIVHPFTSVADDVELGAGTVVLAGAVVNAGTTTGDHCIINTRSSVDHDSKLGEFVSLAPGATLGGNVTVGAYSAIGLGAAVIHGIAIGEQTVVGAGSTVVRSLEARVVAYGSPAEVKRLRRDGDPYL